MLWPSRRFHLPRGCATKCSTSIQRFSLGYLKPFPKFRFGSSDKAFGTPGAGGSFGFADPDTGIGFAYAMNRAGFHLYNDPQGTRASPGPLP